MACAYGMFLVIATGALATTLIVHREMIPLGSFLPSQKHTTPLAQTFGFNFIAIAFETKPVGYVLPTLMNFNFCAFLLYFLAAWGAANADTKASTNEQSGSAARSPPSPRGRFYILAAACLAFMSCSLSVPPTDKLFNTTADGNTNETNGLSAAWFDSFGETHELEEHLARFHPALEARRDGADKLNDIWSDHVLTMWVHVVPFMLLYVGLGAISIARYGGCHCHKPRDEKHKTQEECSSRRIAQHRVWFELVLLALKLGYLVVCLLILTAKGPNKVPIWLQWLGWAVDKLSLWEFFIEPLRSSVCRICARRGGNTLELLQLRVSVATEPNRIFCCRRRENKSANPEGLRTGGPGDPEDLELDRP